MQNVAVYRTSCDSDERLTRLPDLTLTPPSAHVAAAVCIDSRRHFQTIEGFGGAFTEAAATTLLKLSVENQDNVLRSYFDPETGHGYTLCRTHINSCDFALGNYAYTEVEGDTELKHFSIERDRAALIPMIRRAQKLTRERLKLLASPWSPPAWMKTTGQMNKGGKLRPEYREAWARYYCRYIEEYGKEGIRIWGLTIQNEPDATQTWDSCVYTGEEERDFVRDYLGPELQRQELTDVRVVIWDHNRDQMFRRAKIVYDDLEAAKYVWGAGFHWYSRDCFDNVQAVHDAWPEKKLLFTEGCQEGGPHLHSWMPAERYARSIINDLNRWTVGWIDWNLLLDETGGPNHVGNLCSAPIIADTRNNEVLYQPSYWYLGHFSRFIRPGAVRILSSSTRDELEVTAFHNLDDRIAAVVLNRSDVSIPFAFQYEDQVGMTEAPAHSILTLLVPNQ